MVMWEQLVRDHNVHYSPIPLAMSCPPKSPPWWAGSGEPTRTMVPWRQGFRHPTKSEFMGWFTQILVGMAIGLTLAVGPLPILSRKNKSSKNHLSHK